MAGTAANNWRVYSALGRRKTCSQTPPSTASPWFMTSTSSAISATTPMSWVMNNTALPCSRCRSAIRRKISFCVVTSSAVVGSSQMISAGLRITAMAITMRWRWPPLSWCG